VARPSRSRTSYQAHWSLRMKNKPKRARSRSRHRTSSRKDSRLRSSSR
jgi:hypothetical protein